ncbi:MAG: anti-sigma factor antagonist [Streptosporangiaceae bacterium]|jgi:anti-anti-sigma factor|nr:anti-sigma factor antagonist [Streptosporangiaceae bacterium]
MGDKRGPRRAIMDAGDGLEIGMQVSDPWVIVEVEGELDLHTVPLLKSRLRLAELLAEPPPRVAIDLSRLRFCDSSGLNLLVRTWKRLRSDGGGLLLFQPTSQLRHRLAWTGLDRVLGVRSGPLPPPLPSA